MVRANLTLRGLLERTEEMTVQEVTLLLPIVEDCLERLTRIEETVEKSKKNFPVLYNEYDRMASLFEEIQLEAEFKIDPAKYEDSIKDTTRALEQLNAVEEGTLEAKSLDSLV